MNLDTYTTAALSTASPRALDLAYLLPGLVSEAGELIGEFAKAHRDDDLERRRENIRLEYGDVAWFVAVLIHRDQSVQEVQIVRSTDRERQWSIPGADTREAALDTILTRAVSVAKSTGDRAARAHRTARLWLDLERLSEIVTGDDWDTILEANVSKLKARHRDR